MAETYHNRKPSKYPVLKHCDDCGTDFRVKLEMGYECPNCGSTVY